MDMNHESRTAKEQQRPRHVEIDARVGLGEKRRQDKARRTFDDEKAVTTTPGEAAVRSDTVQR